MLHIVEQLIFGMEDLHQFQHLLVGYQSRFGNTWPSIAASVTRAASLAALAIRGIAKGGFARFVTMFALGLPTIGEFHHVVETMRAGHYTPGAVTAVPSDICGLLFLRALVKELRPYKTIRVTAALTGLQEMVDLAGIEPATSSLRTMRSPS